MRYSIVQLLTSRRTRALLVVASIYRNIVPGHVTRPSHANPQALAHRLGRGGNASREEARCLLERQKSKGDRQDAFRKLNLGLEGKQITLRK